MFLGLRRDALHFFLIPGVEHRLPEASRGELRTLSKGVVLYIFKNFNCSFFLAEHRNTYGTGKFKGD